MSSVHRRAVILVCALAPSGCASVGAYHPQAPGEPGGYSERQLNAASWRVEFMGDDGMSREVVESHLLHRAAELTVANGYDWFTKSEQSLDEEAEVVVEGRAPARQSPAWRPIWRHRKHFGWSDWMPAGERGPPPSELRDERTSVITRYAAREDITMGRGAPPPGAFNAREVLALLGTSIERPRN